MTAYELRISDWSSDVCSSDLVDGASTGSDGDHITILNQGDRATVSSFRTNMTNAEATRAAREATVSDERHLLPETLTIESRSRRKHFAHARTALGAFVANDDDGTFGNLTVLDGCKSLFLAIKNTCGTTELQAMHTRDLDDCTIRSTASFQDRKSIL